MLMKSVSNNGISSYTFRDVGFIEVKQNVLKKILNIGDIVVHSKSGNQTVFNSIKKPHKFIEESIFIL